MEQRTRKKKKQQEKKKYSIVDILRGIAAIIAIIKITIEYFLNHLKQCNVKRPLGENPTNFLAHRPQLTNSARYGNASGLFYCMNSFSLLCYFKQKKEAI